MPFLPINNVFTSATSGGPNIITQGLVGLGLLPPAWGIFNSTSGKSVITFTTVKSIDYRQDWNVPDYPIERGSFESYNKVATPFDARITFVSGGFQANKAMIASVFAIAGDLKTYNVVTPEKTFLKANIVHVAFRRNNPVGLVEFDVFLTEIRDQVQSELSQTETRDPSSEPLVDTGTTSADATPGGQQDQVLGQISHDPGETGGFPSGSAGSSVEGSPVIPPTQVPTFPGVDTQDAGTPIPSTSFA